VNPWISATIAIVGGVVLGSVAGRIVRKVIANPSRPDPVRQIAPALASFVFGVIVAVGLITAVGIVSPEQLDTIPKSLVTYLPKVLVAGVLLMAGNVIGGIAAVAVRSAMVRTTGEARPGPPKIVKTVVMATAGILAISQIGIDTTIVNLAVAALLFTIGATATLLIGVGGVEVARNVAAGRYVRRILPLGADIEAGAGQGIVIAVHPATVELRQADGSRIHLPHSAVLAGTITLRDHSPTVE
jgi:hypothetical protein